MTRRSFRVGRSKTGLGLFATRPIRKREFIVGYTGQLITSEESERREARGARYIFELNKKWAIDGSNRRNVGRYVNHSCRPNAESDVKKGKILVRAIRAIKPGQEITYHYGPDYLLNVLTKRGCKCTTCVNKRSRQRAEYRRLAALRLKRAAAKAAKASGQTLSKAATTKVSVAKASKAKASKTKVSKTKTSTTKASSAKTARAETSRAKTARATASRATTSRTRVSRPTSPVRKAARPQTTLRAAALNKPAAKRSARPAPKGRRPKPRKSR